MNMYGYMGKLLFVDLTDRKIKELELKERDAKLFIGGSGLAARIIYNYLTADLSPFSPSNPIVFMTGPFTATSVPSGSRYSVSSLSAWGYWGESTSGGYFGAFLKRSGYDGIFVIGKSEKPVYLAISDNKAEIRSAEHLWGLDTYKTQEEVRKEFDKRARVACVGIAGENLVKFAAIMNDAGRAAGRTGMGAVMGSKKLKAIAAVGNRSVEVANEDALKATVEAVNAGSYMNITFNLLSRYGTLGYLELGALLGDVPARYYTKTVFPAEKVDSIALIEKYKTRKYACYNCPLGCGKIVKFGKMGVDEVDTPEYETVAAFGPLCENYDLDSIIYANHLCNAYGLDTITMGVSIAFMMYLSEKKVIEGEERIEWGDKEKILSFIHMTAKREGIGNVLAEGVKGIAAKYKVSMDYAAHVKGLEIPMHDPRAFFGQALTYATSSRGACHLKPDWYMLDIGAGLAEIGLMPGEVEIGVNPGDRFNMSSRIQSFVTLQNFKELYDALILCKFSQATPFQILGMFNAITGFNFDIDTFLKAGERIINLKRLINIKRGMGRFDDKLPKIVTDALKHGPTSEKSPNVDEMLEEYYKVRKWIEGIPTKEKLTELELDFI